MSEFILEMKGIEKSFSDVTVLKNVNFSLKKGEVCALVGANGAGKSTLMKILGGVLIPNKGEIFLKGLKENFHSPKDALEKGVSIIYQELSLVNTMTVFENVYLNREPSGFSIIDKKQMKQDYQQLADKLMFDIPAEAKVSSLNIANRQLVEIMKALSTDADIIVMDEPTTSLTDTEKEKLFSTIKSLKQHGKTIVYISHILREIFEIADSVTVIRDGGIVGHYPIDGISQMDIAGLVMNESAGVLSQKSVNIRDFSQSPMVLQTENITKEGYLKNVSITLRKGEILGLAGLLGAGRTELCRVLFGDMKPESGKIILNGKKRRFKLPKDAIRAGIGLIPEDRKKHGLVLKHPIFINSTCVCLNDLSSDGLSSIGIVSKKKQFKYTNDQVKKLKIKVSNIGNQAVTLSGGNQQKVVVSKWFGGDFQVYIFDEPTKGIDVGAKEDIFKLVEALAEDGASIIFVSSDLEEVLRVSDRILVMSRGCIRKEITRESFDLQKITAYCMDISEAGELNAG